MERRAYAERLNCKPGSQPRLNEDYGSGLNLPKRVNTVDPDSDSNDELDSFPRSSQPKPKPLSPSSVYKTLKFNKKTKSHADSDGGMPPLKENTVGQSEDPSAPFKKKNAIVPSSPTRPLRDNASRRNSSPDSHSKYNAAPVGRPGTRESRADRPKRRIAVPAPTVKPKHAAQSSASSSIDPDDLLESSSNEKEKGTRSRLRDFPILSPLHDANRETKKIELPSPLSYSKGKGKGTDRSHKSLSGDAKRSGDGQSTRAESKMVAKPFPLAALSPLSEKSPASFLPSPLGTPDRGQNKSLSKFPAPSPLRLGLEGIAGKRPDARPFPMSSQEFGYSPSPEKRRSMGLDSDEERDRKRYKNQPVVLAGSYDYEEESELLFISPATDPKTLCPYCDTPLPSQPTPLLVRLLEQTFKKSYRDPRPTNPLGRKAPIGAFITVCQRHRFESETLPEAEARGWPKSIDWESLKGRVLAMEQDLRRILTDRGDPVVRTDDKEVDQEQWGVGVSQAKKGPRMSCIFWKEFVKELKMKGSKGVTGMQGQFTNFDKTQPGYYGELGSVIIHQTLYDMFPPASMDPSLVDPLTPNDFIQRILVPEVGMRLVIQDMNLNVDDRSDKKCAVAVLRESAGYGVAMFPEDGGEYGTAAGNKQSGDDEEAMGVAEQMIMERARKRRLELEIEEREEEELFRLRAEEVEKREEADIAKQKRKARKKGKEKAIENVAMDLTVRPRPRPKPKHKAKSASSTASESEMVTDPSPRSDHSDIPSPTPSGTVIGPLPTPKPPRSRRRGESNHLKGHDSGSSLDVLVNFPVKTQKRKVKSKRAMSASCKSEHSEPASDVRAVGRDQSSSVTRGVGVMDLFSSSEDDDFGGGASSGKLPQVRPTVVPSSQQARKSHRLSGSPEDDDVDDTPRAVKVGTNSREVSLASSGNFRPLDAARQRIPAAKDMERSGHKAQAERNQWIKSMVAENDTIVEEGRVGSQNSYSWLLDDVPP